MVLRFVLLLLLFFLSTRPVAAPAAEPQPEETLKPVVVTPTRTETPQEQAAASVSTVTAKEIQEQQAETVLEVLRNVAGVDVVQTGSRGNTTSVFIRGSDSDQVLVLLDGVEVNSTTTGAFEFAHLTTDNVERIEILRGAGGSHYGSQSIGGVINIITKRGEGPPRLTLSAEGGNGHTHRQALSLRGGKGKFGYSLTASRLETQGFHRANDDYRNLSASGRLDFRLTENSVLKGIFYFIKNDLGISNSNNFFPAPFADPNAREALSKYLGKLEWEQRIVKEWDFRIAGGFYKEHDKFTDDPELSLCDPTDGADPNVFFCDTRGRSRFRPEIGTAEFQTNYRLGDWSTTTFGVEFKRRKASTGSSSDGADLGGINKAVRNIGYYLQEQFRFLEGRLIVIPGVRLDDHQRFGTEWSPSLSAAYSFKDTGTKLKGGYAEAFKAPTLNELFFPAGFGCPAFGNPALGPERSWEANGGIEQRFFSGRVLLGLTYFHREAEDLIEGRPIPGDPFGCQRAQNVGRARFDGVEWEMTLKILTGLSLGAHYTYLDWDTRDGKLRRRSRHRGAVNLTYLRDRFHVNLNANMVGERDDFRADPPFGDIVKPGYTKVDLASSYTLPVKIRPVKEASLFGKIENLFDKKYQEADGFPAPPLNFLIGIRGVFAKE
jgi:vitamin B12 transporter